MEIDEINAAIDALAIPASEEAARELVAGLKNTITAVENKMSDIGIHHRMCIYIDSCYGSGRSLQLDDDEGDYSDVMAGDWVSSSAERC